MPIYAFVATLTKSDPQYIRDCVSPHQCAARLLPLAVKAACRPRAASTCGSGPNDERQSQKSAREHDRRACAHDERAYTKATRAALGCFHIHASCRSGPALTWSGAEREADQGRVLPPEGEDTPAAAAKGPGAGLDGLSGLPVTRAGAIRPEAGRPEPGRADPGRPVAGSAASLRCMSASSVLSACERAV